MSKMTECCLEKFIKMYHLPSSDTGKGGNENHVPLIVVWNPLLALAPTQSLLPLEGRPLKVPRLRIFISTRSHFGSRLQPRYCIDNHHEGREGCVRCPVYSNGSTDTNTRSRRGRRRTLSPVRRLRPDHRPVLRLLLRRGPHP